jgi:hypothetical protein
MAEPEEDKGNANSEMRYITLELMKLASKRKSTFKKVASEFVENAYALAELLQSVPYSEGMASKKGKGAAPHQDDKEQ